MKTATFILSIIIGIAGVASGVHYHRYAEKARLDLEQERFSRMTAEEELVTANGKNASLESALIQSQSQIEANQDELNQLKGMNEELKARLDKASEIKSVLEEKIEELRRLSS